jgi:hypothetical protein
VFADFANAGFDKDDLEDLKDDMESESHPMTVLVIVVDSSGVCVCGGGGSSGYYHRWLVLSTGRGVGASADSRSRG